MGWDAHSSAPFEYNPKKGRCILKNAQHCSAFNVANQYVKDRCGGVVDGMLRQGSLDCIGAGRMLERALEHLNEGVSVYAEEWTAAQVKRYNLLANWGFEWDKSDKIEKVNFWSARTFLRTCAKLNLSIRFSW